MAGNFGTFSLAKQYGAATDIQMGQAKLDQLGQQVRSGQQLRQSLSNLYEGNPNAGPGDAAQIFMQQGEGGVAAQLYNADAALGKVGTGRMETNITKLQSKRNVYRDMLDIADDPRQQRRLQKSIQEIDSRINKMGSITGRTEFDLPGSLNAKLRGQDLRDTLAIKQIKLSMADVRKNPEAVGVWGAFVENVGGLTGQIPAGVGEMINEGLNTRDITKVRTGLTSLVGPLVSRITGDTSGRYSDRDMERVEDAYAALRIANNSEQALASMEKIMSIIELSQKTTRARYPNIAPKGKSKKNKSIRWEDME